MSTTRIKKLVKSQEQIRIEIENVNTEFKVNFTMDNEVAIVKLCEQKQKKLKHYEPILEPIHEKPKTNKP